MDKEIRNHKELVLQVLALAYLIITLIAPILLSCLFVIQAQPSERRIYLLGVIAISIVWLASIGIWQMVKSK